MKEKRRFFQFAFSLDLSYLNYELKIIKKIKEKENTSMEVTAEDLGKRSFCEAVMRARLPKAVFKELKKTIDYGAPLDAAIADSVAIAMREWQRSSAQHTIHTGSIHSQT